MPILTRIRELGHHVVNALQHPSPHITHAAAQIKSFIHPSAEVGAARRLRVFGTTSKIPPIATAATIASVGALSIPSVMGAGARIATQAATAATGQNVLQTALRYGTYSPFGRLLVGDVAGATAGIAGSVTATAGMIGIANAVTGAQILPTSYQGRAILGSAALPATAHIAALFGFLGRGAKAGALATAGAAETAAGATKEATLRAMGWTAKEIKQGFRVSEDFAAEAYQAGVQHSKDLAEAAYREAQTGYNYVGAELGAGYSAVTGALSGLQFPSIPTNFNVDVGSGQLGSIAALLAAGLGGAYLFKHKKHKKRHVRHRRKNVRRFREL